MKNTLDHRHAVALEQRRKICPEIASRHGVVSKQDMIGFEFRDRGLPRYVKWRTKNKGMFAEPSGEKPILWNIDSLREGTPGLIIITEGEFDALTWLTVGASNVVSVPNGAPAKPGEELEIDPTDDDKFAFLWNGRDLIPELQGCKKILLSTDGDNPGRILAEELAIRLGRDRCWLVEYPEGCKDANDVLVKLGADAVMDLLHTAKALVPGELVPITDLVRNPFSVGHSTGWEGLDDNLMIVPPELMILTGLPNAGKTQWAWSLGANLARVHGWRGTVIQFEDGINRLQDAFLDYAQHWSDDRAIRRYTSPEGWVHRMFMTPKPEDAEELRGSDRTMQWVLDRVKEAGQRHGCRWIIIDPWNEIEHDWQRQYTETQYISRMLKLLKQAARRYSLFIILIAHPKVSSSDKGIEDADLNDVSGGMAWNAKADHGVVLARHPTDKNVIYVKVSKSRNQQMMGFPGIARLHYQWKSNTYEFVGSGLG